MSIILGESDLRIARVRKAACKLLAVACLLCLGCGVARAQEGRSVYLPMVFSAESQATRTTACLQVTERVYSQPAGWQNPTGQASAAETAFKAVIVAIKNKDRAALFNLSDPAQGRDPNRFDQQAAAFFQQFETIEVVAVPRAYEFDDLVVFFAKLRSRGRTFFAPFIFAHEADGSFLFLPYRTDQLTYQLVEAWFNSEWGPAATDNPAYCADSNIKRATHRISLATASRAAKQVRSPSFFFLAGASTADPGEFVGLAERIRSTIEELKSSLVRGVDEFVKHMTPEGGNRLKEWFASASEPERNAYKASIMDRRAFFVVDASPLMVVYTRSSAGIVQVMYFTANANNELLWTNSSHITVSDKVFKKGAVYDSALLNKPFGNGAVR